jgi:outer membrane murein-binding lipoprotein Lpp
MTSPIESQRKVRQLENDVTSIYELLGSIQETQHKHGDQLDEVAAQTTRIVGAQLRQGNRLDSIEATVHDLGIRFDGLEETQRHQADRLDSMDARLGTVDTKVDSLDTKVDGLDTKVDGLDTKVDGLDTKVDGLDTKVDGLATKVDALDGKVDTILDVLRGDGAAQR